MADAELRLRAVLDDDASRGIDQLDSRVRESGQAAAEANRLSGRSAAQAARDTGSAAARISSAYGAAARAATNFARSTASAVSSKARGLITGTVGALGRLRDGYRSSAAAASTFSGRMGTVGGALRKLGDAAKRGVSSMSSAFNSAADQGRVMGQKIVDGVKSKVSNLGSILKDGMKNAGLVAGAVLGGAIVMQIGASIKNAGDLEQSMGAIQAVFKENAGQMIQWSTTAAETTGLSKLEYQNLATVLGASLKNGGMAMDQVAGKTNDLIAVGADLSSMFGGTTAEAVEAMTAALRGESDPIEKYGVSLTAAKVEAEALAMGANKVNGELTTQAKQAAILSLIQKQTADSTGNFARETDTFAGGLQILKARWADLTTQWATYVIPLLTTLVGFVSNRVLPAISNLSNAWAAFWVFLRGGSDADWGVLEGLDLKAQNAGLALHNLVTGGGSALMQFARDLLPALTPLGSAIQGFAKGMGEGFTQLGTTVGQAMGLILPALIPVIAGLAQVTAKILELTGPALPVLIPLLGGAFLAFKLFAGVAAIWGGITTAVGLLTVALRILPAAIHAIPFIGWAALAISALVLMYQKVGWFRDAVNTAFAWLTQAIQASAKWIVEAWRNAGAVLTQVWTNTRNEVSAVTTFFTTAWRVTGAAVAAVWNGIRSAVGAAVTWVATTARSMWDGAVRAFGAVTTWLKSNVIDPAWFGIRLVIAVVVGVLMTLWQGMVWLIRNTLGPVFTWLHRSIIVPVWNAIRTAVSAAWSFIRDSVFNPLMAFIRGPLTTAWRFIQTTITTVWTIIRTASSAAWNFLRGSVLQPTINFIRGVLTAAWVWLRTTATNVWNNVRSTSLAAWTFLRNSVFQPTINFVRGAFTAAWTYIRNTISTIWGSIRSASSAAWSFLRNNVFQPIINFVRGALTGAWTYLRDGVVRPVWNTVSSILSSGWSTIKSRVFDPMTNFVRNTIPNAFRAAVDSVRSIWDRIVSTVRGPVDSVIGIIKNTLVGNINKVLSFLRMPTINAFAAQGPMGGGGGMARAPGFRSGGYTGPGHPGAPAGVVHRDEHVIHSAARRSVERRRPGFFDDVNARGAAALNDPGHMAVGSPVYAGYPSFSNPLQHAVFSSGTLNVAGSAPGWDLAGAIGMLDRATRVKVQAGGLTGGGNTVRVSAGPRADWWAGYYQGHDVMLNNSVMGASSVTAKRTVLAHELGHALGLPHSDPSGKQSIMSYANMYSHNSVTAADVAALSSIYGGTGFGSGGSGPDLLGMLTKGVETALNAVTSGGIIGQLAVGVGKHLFNQAKTWATSKLPGASRGMVLPGYSPRTDQTPIMASQGESVLTPELTSALGPANIQAANLASSGAKTPGTTRKALGLLGAGDTGGGGNVIVQMDVTIQGNADTDALEQMRDQLEHALGRILEDAQRRGY